MSYIHKERKRKEKILKNCQFSKNWTKIDYIYIFYQLYQSFVYKIYVHNFLYEQELTILFFFLNCVHITLLLFLNF